MKKEKDQYLPGQEPPPQAAKFEALNSAIEDVHDLICKFEVPEGSTLKMEREIHGDKVNLTFKKGK